MKKLYKVLISAVLLLVVVLSTVVTSYAAAVVADAIMGDISSDILKWCLKPVAANEGEEELVAAKNYLDSVWRIESKTTGTVDVTYQTLSDVVAQLNVNGVPCQIKQLRGAGVTGYVIQGMGTTKILDGYGTYSISGKFFTNTAGAMFRAHKDNSGSSGGSTEVSVDTSGIIQMLQTIQSAIAGLDNTLANILNANDEGFTMLGALTGWTNSYIVAYGDKISAQCSSISTSLADLEIKMNSLMTYIPSMSTDIYSISNAVNSIDTNVITVSGSVNEIYAKVSTISDRLAGWTEWFNSMYVDLYAIHQNSTTIASDVHANLSGINTTASAILKKLDNLNITTSVNYDDSNILYYLGAIESRAYSISSGVDSISSNTAAISAQLVTGGPILIRLNSIQSSAISILEKLDDLKTYDDTNLIAALGRIENNFGDLNTTLGDLNVTTDFTDTNIVAAVNNLASLFSLGETYTFGAGETVQFSEDMDAIQSVSL